MTHGFIAESRRERLRAIRALRHAGSPDVAFALRRLLYADHDANVRAAAALALAHADAPIEAWLVDAIADISPLVRDAILRTLAKRGGEAAVAVLRRLIRDDRMWWVRRSAIYALAAVAGATQLDAFTAALADPFWRVRQAAVRVLAVLGARDLDVRADIVAAPPSSTLTYLRAAWGPVAIDSAQRAVTPSALPPALLDPDPAVVTARLASADASPVALVELLCDPHEPLRTLAAHRIAASRDRAALLAALDWLDEPRIPHVADTVETMLDSLGDDAAEIAAHALGREDRPGAARWAIGWVIATRYEALADAARERARTTPSLRRAALRLASIDELVAWAADAALVDAIASELHDRRAHDALLTLDAHAHPRARALQIDAAATAGAWSVVEAGLADPHHGPRAVATRWLVRARRIDGVAQLADPDPAVREAALSQPTAPRLAGDPDPWVRRAAIHVVAATWRDRDDVPADAAEAVRAALTSRDPWLRAEACRVPAADLAGVVACLGDRDEMVRSAALDALSLRDRDPQLRALLATHLPDRTRALVHAWLHRDLDPDAARAALADVDSPRARAWLAAVAGDAVTASSSETRDGGWLGSVEPRETLRATDDVSTPLVRRPFGRAGFDVAPLAISGAFDIDESSLAIAADAGVDLYFWEPSYDALTRFLRRRREARVIAGSYHADAASIAADVDRALRRLRRDTLDTFLLFWTRSPSRVDDAAFEALARIRQTGKVRAIGFSTHHRELARTAIETTPWDVVMIRHSAAHPGIETELLPAARKRGTAIITFSALCYGRMLAGPGAPSATDCYRYSIAQPGVTACISAPRRHGELVENLGVLRAPPLADHEIAALRAHGAGVRAESQRFNTLLRQPTRDAAAAAREMLAAELPPAETIETRALPKSTSSRKARTDLARRRR
jgi:diketogulonate reductase-like aldo/keto reductase